MPIGGVQVTTSWKPTGRYRLRASWLGRVVVEMQEVRSRRLQDMPSIYRPFGEFYRWRKLKSSDCNNVFFTIED